MTKPHTPNVALASCVELGKFGREWGIRGQIIGYFHNPDSPIRDRLSVLYTPQNEPDSLQAFVLESPAKPHGNQVLFKIKGVDTPEAAKAWRGKAFYCKASELPELEPDNFYWMDILGSDVWDETGSHWGVADHFEGSATYRYLVILAPSGQEVLYPAQPETVLAFERDKRRLTVRHIGGLREKEAAVP